MREEREREIEREALMKDMMRNTGGNLSFFEKLLNGQTTKKRIPRLNEDYT